MKRLLLFILTFSMIISLALPFSFTASAEGEDVIEIGTAEDLLAIGTDETTLAGNYKLTADIVTTTGITGEFTGTFDGNGHKVSGLTTALFEAIGSASDAATVKNVIVSANINGTTAEGEGEENTSNGEIKSTKRVGIAAGKINPDSVIENITTYGSIVWDANNITTSTGAIAGEAWTGSVGNNNTITVKNCTNKATITVNNTTKYGSVAGIVGNCTGYGTLSVYQCVNEGAINMNGGKTSPAGIVGRFNELISGTTLPYGLLSECANLGDITVTGASGEYSTGIVGAMRSGTISKCYNVGELTDSRGTYGIIGYVNMNKKAYTVVAEYCYNATDVKLSGEFWHTLKDISDATVFRGCYYLAKDINGSDRIWAPKSNWEGVLTRDSNDKSKAVDTISEIYENLKDNGYVSDPNVDYPILAFQLENLTLNHTDDDGSSFFYQQGTTDTTTFRIIGLVDTDIAKTAKTIEVTFTNEATNDSKKFILGDDETVYAYSSIDATFNGTTVTYVACDDAVILGWVFTGVPAGYVPSAAVIVD